jgi:uncharacterized membrane protein
MWFIKWYNIYTKLNKSGVPCLTIRISKQGGNMNKQKNLWVARISVIAALYVALTLISYPFSYGMIQFRISEALMLLCFYNKKYNWALIIGCLVSNFFSFNIIDCIFGVLATVLACIAMNLVKNKVIASLFPAIFNGVIIGLELYFILDLPFVISMVSVAVGEIVVVTILGNFLFYFITKNSHFMELIGIK